MKTTNDDKQNLSPHNIFAITCLAAVLGLAGCEKPGTAEKAGKKIDQAAENAGKKIDQATKKAEKQMDSAKDSVTEKAQTAGEYIDDSVITMKVKSALLNDPLLKSSQIEVTTVNGVVRLSGALESEASIGNAAALVAGQPNVKSVQNDLVVKAGTPSN